MASKAKNMQVEHWSPTWTTAQQRPQPPGPGNCPLFTAGPRREPITRNKSYLLLYVLCGSVGSLWSGKAIGKFSQGDTRIEEGGLFDA